MRVRPVALVLCVALLACAESRHRPDAPAAAEVRYLALGDSFTIGTGSGPEAAFPARLAARWQAQGRRVALRNLAVNGYTTEDLLRDELPAASGFSPTLVTLAIGANDLVRGSDAEGYRAQVRRIFTTLRAGGVPAERVVALPQPDWSASPAAALFGERGELRAEIERFNQVLAEEARAAGARYVDLFPLMRRQARDGLFASDGLHPAARCHDEWAAALGDALGPGDALPRPGRDRAPAAPH